MEKFKSIPELIQSLNHLALRINKGSVGLDEFENTLNDARELYERLVILRYKAIEDRNLMGMPSSPQKSEASPPDSKSSIVEEPTLAARQISLIDSIEEISRETEPEIREEQVKKEQPAQPVVHRDPPVKKESPVAEVVPPVAQRKEKAQPQSTLPDSVADKLSQTKIDDLTVAIGLNQKFQFIKELFNGDSKAYNEAVKSLNQCENLQQAKQRVTTDLMKSYEWDEENRVTVAFLNLIERRYQ